MEEYLWHINFSEDVNFLEAEYITGLVRIAEKKLKTNYKKLLDVPCGTGRLHKYLRENGFDVYGIDVNSDFIKKAQETYPEFKEKYFIKDMREIEYKEEFDVVLNWFTSFGYFDHKDNLKVLEKFYEALKPKGILILDVPAYLEGGSFVYDYRDYIEIAFNTVENEGDKIVNRHSAKLYKKENDTLKVVKSLELTMIVYSPKKLREMLEESGFKVLYAFKNRSFTPIDADIDFIQAVNKRIRRIVWLACR